MPRSDVALPFRIGTRTLGTIRRRLERRPVSLEEALTGEPIRLPEIQAADHGWLITGLPTAQLDALAGTPGMRAFVRQYYPRSFARLDIGFDAYLAGFSSRSRSTLKRKCRRLADRSGGRIDLRCFRTERDLDVYYPAARELSSRTYQERQIGAGLPAGSEALERMRALARADQLRAWLLFVDGRPVAYLHCPGQGGTLIYAHLGYDPEFASWSPGSVLQFEAMRALMEEGRFRLFDFTEGDGQHKRQFATGSVDCADLLLVRPTWSNLAAGHALTGFDKAVEAAKKMIRPRRTAGQANA